MMHGPVDEREDDDTEPVITFEDIEARQRSEDLGITQRQTLSLRPWQYPTCYFFYHTIEEIEAIIAAGPQVVAAGAKYHCAVLAKKLLDAGLSLHEPDPERALDDPAYREKINERVRKLEAANKNGLTEQTIKTIISLAPYPLMCPTYEDPHAEKETSEFRRLLAEQCPGPVTITACEQVIDMMWEKMQEKRKVEREEHDARNRCQPKAEL
jgi:hypothetical protein